MGRINNVNVWNTNRVSRRAEVRQQFRRYPLRRPFWQNHRYWGRWAFTRPYRWATWGALTGWFTWGWSQPAVYSYGDNIYYEGDTVYYESEPLCTVVEYADQAATLIASAPEVTEQDEWLQLGVFAVTQDGQASGPPPTMYLQLAVNKEGVIAGVYYNTTTDESFEVEGAVDSETQRVAWVGVDQQWPIMETGISNLTEESAPALVHFEGGVTQQWLMVRVEEESEGDQ